MSNDNKIAITQCIRTIFIMVAALIMIVFILIDPTSVDSWQIFTNTLCLWAVGDLCCHIYLEILYQRAES